MATESPLKAGCRECKEVMWHDAVINCRFIDRSIDGITSPVLDSERGDAGVNVPAGINDDPMAAEREQYIVALRAKSVAQEVKCPEPPDRDAPERIWITKQEMPVNRYKWHASETREGAELFADGAVTEYVRYDLTAPSVPNERDAALELAAKIAMDEVMAMDGQPYSTLQRAACVAARIRALITPPLPLAHEPMQVACRHCGSKVMTGDCPARLAMKKGSQ